VPRRVREQPISVRAEINVTSLVDVAFTLLIIFIITAPILQGGIEVSVPRAEVRPLTAGEDPLYITIAADGTVYLEETAVDLDELGSGLAQIVEVSGVERVYIRGDSLADFGPVVRVMAAVANSGISWSVVAEPHSEN